MRPIEIPRFDLRPADAQPRLVQFRESGRLSRRGFLAVLGAGAMTLGMTVLGWIPLARPARAEPGTEFMDCGTYGDGPGGPLCYGAPYSPRYCGEDKWFLTGCYRHPEGQACYEPVEFCRAAGPDGGYRNAWRWESDNIIWRCADGQVYWEGAPSPDTVICNAKLAPAQPTSPEPTAPPPSSSPDPRPTWPSGPPSASDSPEPLLPLPLGGELPVPPLGR